MPVPAFDVVTYPGGLPHGAVGEAYFGMVWAVNAPGPGANPCFFTFTPHPNFPPGLFVNSAPGAITGIPTTAGTYTFTVRATVTIAPSFWVEEDFTIVIDPASTPPPPPPPPPPPGTDLALICVASPSATVGVPYSDALSASGGAGGYVYALDPGESLPSGLHLSPSGAITGTPDAEGMTIFAATVTDALGVTAGGTCYISVGAAGTPPPPPPPGPATSTVTCTIVIEPPDGGNPPNPPNPGGGGMGTLDTGSWILERVVVSLKPERIPVRGSGK